jgi:uracil-DNA glycosylase family 4
MTENLLNQLKYQCQQCRRCTELATTRTNVVFGEGPANAAIMLIGEAPGREEDQLNQPFVGQAGQILNDCLTHATLKRTEIYITSCLKCRPPNNRKPHRQEITNCRHWLESQIHLIHPQIIVVMGNVASYTLLKLRGMTKHHGKIITTPKTHYLITYHPAAILYNRPLKTELINDLKKIHPLLTQEPKTEESESQT